MFPLCCGSCRGLSFQSYLPVLTCTWAAEQDPLCVFLCGSLPGVCLTWERVVIPQRGWPLSFYLCALRNFTFFISEEEASSKFNIPCRQISRWRSGQKEMCGQISAVDGVGGGHLLASFYSGSFSLWRVHFLSGPLWTFSCHSDSTSSPKTCKSWR